GVGPAPDPGDGRPGLRGGRPAALVCRARGPGARDPPAEAGDEPRRVPDVARGPLALARREGVPRVRAGRGRLVARVLWRRRAPVALAAAEPLVGEDRVGAD